MTTDPPPPDVAKAIVPTPEQPVRETGRGWLRRLVRRYFPASPPPGWEIVTDGKHYRWRHNGSVGMVNRATYLGTCRAAWWLHRDNEREAKKNWQLVSPPNAEVSYE